MLQIIAAAFAVLIFSTSNAYAYIDPGSGGYLISSLIAWIGGALAVSAAVIIHFFRYTFKTFAVNLWSKHRLIAILLVVLIISGLAGGGYCLFKPSLKHQGGLVATAPSSL